MLIRKTLATALSASLLFLSACSSQMPLANQLMAQRQVRAASVTPQSTNGALNLIEEMAHASDPADFERIESAFRGEIAKSTRPSLKKILSKAVEAIHHHPIPGDDILNHPVVRLIYAAQERYLDITGKTLMQRIFLIFDLAQAASPSELESKVQKFQRSLNSLPKMDAQELQNMFAEGFFQQEVAPGSPLEACLLKLLQERMAARF